jgi:hypothetical protein
VKEGRIHSFFKAQGGMIAKFGRLFESDEFINEQRADLGLPPVFKVNVDEVSKILEKTKVKEMLALEKGE